MQKILTYFLIIISFTLTSCVIFNGDDEFNSAKLRSSIIDALKGDREANVKLSGLIDKQHYLKTDFNKLSIDSGYINYKHYYSVLLEYYDPTLNLFAIYDSNSRLLLLDKSLNGNLSAVWADKDSRNFVFIQERFLTKDVISLDRISLYEVKDTTAGLIYRSLSRLVENNDTSYQIIESISPEIIVTKISGSANSGINNRRDTFKFDPVYNKYISDTNLFNEYVKNKIADFSWITTKPQIPANSLSDENKMFGDGYQISLRGNWQKVAPFTETILLKENLAGTKYTNTNLNSSITVFMLPKGKTGEDYALYNFVDLTTSDYKIRATELYTMDKNYNQLFEHSCGNKKFLLLIDSPIEVYQQNKKNFTDIINSFLIDCVNN